MDNFLDVITVRKKKGLYNLLYFLASLFMIVIALIAVFFMNSIITPQGISIPAIIIFVVLAGVAFLLFWSRSFIRIDYDISFTNGLVEIARVANNVKRKELIKFYMKNVDAAAPTTSPNFNRYSSMKDIKKINASLNKDEKKFFLVVKVKDATNLIIIEHNEELITLMKQYNPLNVKVD
jgi:hypothetical protein